MAYIVVFRQNASNTRKPTIAKLEIKRVILRYKKADYI